MEHSNSTPHWRPQEVARENFAHLFNVYFSHVGQCTPEDCEAQRQAFDLKPFADQQEAWRHKHLLDMDGNAFSGRFYAFLHSQSLTYKMTLFREWHMEWLKPWVHYVPLSLNGSEWVEALRWFSSENEGKLQARRIAEASTEWAKTALRNEDIEAWFFRLLLE